jgi:hypothetical protein
MPIGSGQHLEQFELALASGQVDTLPVFAVTAHNNGPALASGILEMYDMNAG